MSPLVFLVFVLRPAAWAYEAPEDKQDVFAKRACPAFLTFTNAAFLSGVTVELPCHCKPPQVQSVVWYFRKHLGSSEVTRALTDHRGNKLLDTSRVPHGGDLRSRFSIRLFSLLIFRATPDDSGVYICGSSHKDFFYSYDLDIQDARIISVSPRLSPERTSNKLKHRKGLGSVQPPYRVFTSFRPWTVCDRCGVPGEQVRVGLCYVDSKFLHVRYRRANETTASCGSGAVPGAFSRLTQTRTRAKLEVRSCHVTCPDQAPSSSSLLALMEFLGHSSASQPAGVPVYHLTHPADRVLTLGCPGARPNMAVAWDRGSEPIYRFKHSAGGNVSGIIASRRLTIDAGHHLVFKPAQSQDSGVYHCWLQGRRAAQIRLLVYIHLGRGQSVTSHPDFPDAVRTVLKSYAAVTGVFLLLVFGQAGVRYVRDITDSHVD